MAQPFSIDVPDEVLADLRDRLARTRLLPDSPGKPASGMSAAYLAELIASWRQFDWRARERWLNEHPQYLVDLGDVTVHFTHLRSARDDAPVLLVMHGWPHTFALQLAFADLLTDFHVVVPSLPGFAFSSPYRSGLLHNLRLAETMHRLMTDVLGYDRYLTYGEDVTADVNDLLAATHPESVRGVIVTHAHFPTMAERANLDDPPAIAFFERLDAERYAMSGYAHEQGTRPDTLAIGLNDSPAGLLGWITEKLVEWSDTPEGDPRGVERRIARERILTEATIYWVTQTIASSFRPYFEARAEPPIPPVAIPASVHIQRHERDNPESVARAFYRDLRTFERLDEGGHFAVAEVPAAMAERTRAFARELGLLAVV
ncbi:epoxide hydrolase [Microbacterium rhizosphaerae]